MSAAVSAGFKKKHTLIPHQSCLIAEKLIISEGGLTHFEDRKSVAFINMTDIELGCLTIHLPDGLWDISYHRQLFNKGFIL